MKNRPLGITLIAIILFLAGATAFMVGISALIHGTPLDALWTMNSSFPPGFQLTFAGMAFGVFIIILGLVILYTGWGLLKGHKWAWWMAVIIFSINGISNIARIALGGIIEGIFGILVAAGFVYYLTRPKVKEFFIEEV